MSTREFHYQEGTSSKFWRITVAGQACTVQFGRIGTAGQVQTKTFADTQAAQAAGNKQIAEKLKKGYREVDVAQNAPQLTIATPPPSVLNTQVQLAVAPPVPINSQQPAPIPEPTAPAIYDPTPRVNLDPHDWFWATWRRSEPFERPAAAPFDRADVLRRLRQMLNSGHPWQWETVIPEFATREEAAFWLQVLSACQSGRSDVMALAKQLETTAATSSMTLEQAVDIFRKVPRSLEQRMIALLATLFSPQEIMTWVIDVRLVMVSRYLYTNVSELVAGFRRYVVPYLSPQERARLSHTLTPQLEQAQWPVKGLDLTHPAFYFAAMLGGHQHMLRRIIESWIDDRRSYNAWSERQKIVFGLDDSREVEAQVRQLKLPLDEPDYIRAWLAHTEDRALDVVYASVLGATEPEVAAALTHAFALVASPAVAPHMFMLAQESQAPEVASAWLDAHPSHTVAGLLPLVDSRSAQATPATDHLRRLVRRGYRNLIEQALATLPAATAARLRAHIVEVAQPDLPPFDDHTTPAWLAEALRAPVQSKANLPSWVRISDLMPIVIGQHVLSPQQVERLVQALKQDKRGAEHPLIHRVKQHADSLSLDHFAWSLFTLWMAADAPSKENWAFFTLGVLGGDGVVLKLAPLIRVWPGENQHPRAVNGLECLRMIGSDTALMQISSIAQKAKFKGLQNRAVECINQIAEERGLSRAQLEDLLVPDCELDARGQRIFDYGPRQFRFVLGPEMKPMLRDPEGKLKPNLPPPTTKDDPEKAAQALAEWKLLKKQVAEVASIQAVRLEQAMVTSRRWTRDEFEMLLVRHPLMTHLAQALIWGVYDQQGTLERTFRVTEDQSYADLADQTVELPADALIGLIHPFYLPSDERAAWGEILSDYEIAQPFVQLSRAIQRLEADELSAVEITRFNELTFPAPALIFGLEKLGWTRDLPGDSGGIWSHFKPFSGSNVTTVIKYEHGVSPETIMEEGDQNILHVAFVPGILKAERSFYWPHKNRLVLGDVDPFVISEVLYDMLVLVAKAT